MTDTMTLETIAAVHPITGTNRLFAAGERASYHQHVATFGSLDHNTAGNGLVAQLERSGLAGRGGAGFSVGRKFAAMGHGRFSRVWRSSAVVIANGAEGEPRSLKDERLLRDAPHLVIDGLLAAAAAVQASKLYIYSTAASQESVRRALRERRDAHAVMVVEAPDTFISGEASAVINSIENGVPLPTDRTQRLTTVGLKQRPTLIHNVETLAHVALIARYGADWFRSVGTDRDPGTRLVTISGAVQRELVLEVPGDTRINDIIRACGGDTENVRAVLVGGYHGAWVTAAKLDANLSAPGLAPFGAHPGAGVLYVLPTNHCGLHITAEIVRYLARESAKQCGPCRYGLPEMATLLEKIASGVRDPKLPAQLRAVSGSVVGRGSCHHPNGTTRLVLNTLEAFSDDVQAHLSGRCLRTAS